MNGSIESVLVFEKTESAVKLLIDIEDYNNLKKKRDCAEKLNEFLESLSSLRKQCVLA